MALARDPQASVAKLKCPNCQTPAQPEDNFCVECGWPLPFHCSRCGQLADPASSTCEKCDQRLVKPTAAAPTPATAALESSADLPHAAPEKGGSKSSFISRMFLGRRQHLDNPMQPLPVTETVRKIYFKLGAALAAQA
jgi:hypothetical protein